MNRDNHDKQMLKALTKVALNTQKIADNMQQDIFSRQVANLKLKEFKDNCLEIAKENWTKTQRIMLEALFEAVEQGTDYQCTGCPYLGRVADAPETVPKECLWEPDEEDADGYVVLRKPCEDE